MNTKKLLCIVAFAAFIGSPLRADIMEQVTMDTSSLASIGGTWTLDFQLIQDQSLANTVTISDITLGGGTYLTGMDAFNGEASGTFPNYTLSDDTNVFNEALIQFTAGTQVQFDLSYTNNFDGTTADAFTWAVEGPSGSIVSSFLGAGLDVLLDGTNNYSTYAADDAYGDITPNVTPIVTVGAVPEPTRAWLVLAGLLLLALAYQRIRFNRSPNASRSSI